MIYIYIFIYKYRECIHKIYKLNKLTSLENAKENITKYSEVENIWVKLLITD